jgi:hypothetical protein
MWPWGHLAFGYVIYSLTSRGWFDEPPRGPSVYLLAFATQLPDLVDKPLSWVFGVFPTGYSVAHSVFVAVPVAVAVALVAWRWNRLAVGVAFVVGYWSHLVGDLLVGAVTEQQYVIERVLWPVATLPPYAVRMSAFDRGLEYFTEFVAHLRATNDPTLLLLYLGPFVAAFVIWIVDGMPGIPWIRRRTVGTS